MKKLDQRYRKYGYNFDQVYRDENTAIYRQSDEHKKYGYEVFEIKIVQARLVFGRMQPQREAYPSSEEFGGRAYSVETMEQALEKLQLFKSRIIARTIEQAKRKGGYEILGGGLHSENKDTNLGFEVDGAQAYAERGEGIGIFNRSSTKRYGSILPQLVQAINQQKLESILNVNQTATKDIPLIATPSFDNSRVENILYRMEQQGKAKEQWFNDAQGRLVRIRGNVRTTFV